MNTSAKKYWQGLAWFSTSLIIGALNDTLMKMLANGGVHFGQIIFGRLLTGTIFMLPYSLVQPGILRTKHILMHTVRGGIFVVAMALWSYGLTYKSNTMGTVIGFTIPIFVCILSAIFLKEQLTLRTIISVSVGFFGICVVMYPKWDLAYNWQTLAFVAASLLFAILDVLNKYHTTKDAIYTMIFYANLAGICLTLPIAYKVAPFPQAKSVLYLTLLGLGGNAIIYCLLKSYQLTSLITLAPMRYLELIISVPVSIFIFQKTPYDELRGALFIIPAALSIIYEKLPRKEHK